MTAAHATVCYMMDPKIIFPVNTSQEFTLRLQALGVRTIGWYGLLHYTTLQYNTIQQITLHYHTLNYISLHYITLHYNKLDGVGPVDNRPSTD